MKCSQLKAIFANEADFFTFVVDFFTFLVDFYIIDSFYIFGCNWPLSF